MAEDTVGATEAVTLAEKASLAVLVSSRVCWNVKVPVQTTLWNGATPPVVNEAATAASSSLLRPALQVSATSVPPPDATVNEVTCKMTLPVFTNWTCSLTSVPASTVQTEKVREVPMGVHVCLRPGWGGPCGHGQLASQMTSLVLAVLEHVGC
jgi:hypothetical protein